MAYHIEALARTKRLPDLARLTGEQVKAQTEDEMLANLERFVALHNARWKADQSQEQVNGS